MLKDAANIDDLLNITPYGVFIIDLSGKIIFASKMAAKRLNKRAKEMIGTTLADYFPIDISEKRRLKGIEAINSGISQSIEDKVGDRWYFSKIIPIKDKDEKIISLAIFSDDITDRKRTEEDLQKSEEQFRDLYDNAPVGYFEYDLRGNITRVNHTYLWMLGYTAEEVIGQPCWKFIVDEVAREQTMAKLDGVRPPAIGLERTYRRKDGTTFPVLFQDRLLLDEDCHIKGIRTAIQDITDRKDAEESLKEREESLQAILDNSPTLICEYDLEGRYIRVNQAVTKLLQRHSSELIGKTFSEILPADTAELFLKRIELVSNTCKPITVEDHLLTPEGDQHFITTIFPLFDSSGRIRRIGGIANNITERKQAEIALKESEQFLQILLESIPLPVFYKDVEGRYKGVNKAFETFFGRPKSELIGCSVFDINPPELARIYHAKDSELFKKITTQIYESEVKNAYGELRDIVFYKGTLTNTSGAITGLVGTIIDITERKRAETYREMGREILQILNEPGDLQESTQRVLTALKAWTGFDAVGLRLQEGEDFPYFVQDGFSKDFLLTENTLLERDKDGGVCRDKDGNVCLECTCGLVISGKTDPSDPLFTKGGSSWTNDSFPFLDLPSDQDPRLHPRNNCIHQGYASVALIPVRTSDRIVGLIQLNDKCKGRFTLETIEILESIAAHVGSALMRKRAEAALKASEKKYQSLFVNAQVALFRNRLSDGKVLEINERYAKMAGYSNIEDCMANFNAADAWIDPNGRNELLGILQENGSVRDYETEIMRRDGTNIWISFSATIFPEQGFLEGSIVEITERKRSEAEKENLQTQLNQAQKMESVGRLAGGVAHDFNNMLGVILGHTELALLQADENHDLYSDLIEIQKAAKRSADITKQLLAFARKQTISPKKLDLNDTVESMLKMLRRLIGEDIDLVWQPGVHLWPVKMDPSQIDQILANLCINARDAISGAGKLTIETGKKTFDEKYCKDNPGFIPGDFSMLAVSDNGCGMDKTTLQNLFEPFYTTKDVGKGTGLGLSTVYGIVKQNNGFINVYSEPGRGSTFKIYLSRLVVNENIDKVVPDKKATAGGTETILLVEDEPSILRMTRMMLERKGYTVLTATTPADAMKKAKNHSDSIDLLMTDVVMPGMNGRDLAGQISTLYPDIGLLFMSGYTADVIAHQGVLDAGVAFIQKPFSLADMTEKVREVLDNASDNS